MEVTRKSTTHKERIFHIPVEHERWKYVTVFCREESPGLWYYQRALCDKRDQFCRKIGRTLARRRYFLHMLPLYVKHPPKWEDVVPFCVVGEPK